jgi:hypothetical protein
MRSVARKAELGPGGNGRRRVTFLLSLQDDGSIADLAAYLAGVSNAVVGREEGGHGAPTDAARVPTASGRGAPLATDGLQQRRSRQQGYVADAAYRRAVELHAMRIAVEHYEDAWEVEDTSAGHPYDLVIRSGGRTRYIEVKGTTGTGDQIHLTANEVDHVRRRAGEVALFLVHSIVVDRTDPAVPTASGGRVRILDPLDLRVGQLRETAYAWGVPRDTASTFARRSEPLDD